MMSEGTLKEVGFWDERIHAPPKGGTAMLTAVHIKDDAAGQEAMRDAMSRRSASSAKKERSKSKVGSTARNSGHSPKIRTEDKKPKTSYSDVGNTDRGRKRQRTNKIVQNASAKSVKSKAGSTASNSDNTPEILPMHETPNISFDDTGNDDSVDEVDELVVDGTSRGEDRSASSGDDDSIQLVTLLGTVESMRKDACRGGLKTEAEVLRTFKESACSAGHSMIKHVNVTSKAETLLRGVSSVFVLLPCSCEGGSDLGTLV